MNIIQVIYTLSCISSSDSFFATWQQNKKGVNTLTSKKVDMPNVLEISCLVTLRADTEQL